MPIENAYSANSFAERIAKFVDKVEYRRAETNAELDAIRQLRYEAYLKEGAIEVSETRQLVDQFDEGDNLVNIGIFLDQKLVSAIRLHILERREDVSPALEAFPDVIEPIIASGKRIVDPNRLVADYAAARAYPELPYATLRIAGIAGFYYDANFVTATVRSEHHAFYKRSFFATSMCPPRPYPFLSKKIGLMFIDYEGNRDRLLQRNPYWTSTEEELRQLFGLKRSWWKGDLALGESARGCLRGATHYPTRACG